MLLNDGNVDKKFQQSIFYRNQEIKRFKEIQLCVKSYLKSHSVMTLSGTGNMRNQRGGGGGFFVKIKILYCFFPTHA
jgi:hypothetical protein